MQLTKDPRHKANSVTCVTFAFISFCSLIVKCCSLPTKPALHPTHGSYPALCNMLEACGGLSRKRPHPPRISDWRALRGRGPRHLCFWELGKQQAVGGWPGEPRPASVRGSERLQPSSFRKHCPDTSSFGRRERDSAVASSPPGSLPDCLLLPRILQVPVSCLYPLPRLHSKPDQAAQKCAELNK